MEADMAKLGTMTLKGASGNAYEFGVYPRTDTFKSIGGLYFLTVRTPKPDGTGGTHSWVYVGETGDLSKRPFNHHRKACFDRRGANAVLIHVESDPTTRLTIETDLRRAYDPPCNQQ
jgi:hypothetical protein